MKMKRILNPAALMWLVILIAYTAALIQIPGGPGTLLVVGAGVVCVGTALAWSELLKAKGS